MYSALFEQINWYPTLMRSIVVHRGTPWTDDAAEESRGVSAFDIEAFADSISVIPIRESLNWKGSLWPRETII